MNTRGSQIKIIDLSADNRASGFIRLSHADFTEQNHRHSVTFKKENLFFIGSFLQVGYKDNNVYRC